MDRSLTGSDRLIDLFAHGDPDAFVEVWSLPRANGTPGQPSPSPRSHRRHEYEVADVLEETIVRIFELMARGRAEAQEERVQPEDATRECQGNGHPTTFTLDDLDVIASPAPQSDVMVEMLELVERLLDLLENPELLVVARMKLDGYTEPEIAAATDSSLRTVQRRLARIGEIWNDSGLLGD